MAKLLEWIGNGIACLCLLPFLIALSLADRFGKKKDLEAVRKPHRAPSAPEYTEETPTLPPAFLPHKSDALTPDRPRPLAYAEKRKDTPQDWEAFKLESEIYALIGDVREGDPRG